MAPSKKIKVVAARADRVCPEVIGEDTAHITLKAENGAMGTVAGNFYAAGFPLPPTDRLDNLKTLQLVSDVYGRAGL